MDKDKTFDNTADQETDCQILPQEDEVSVTSTSEVKEHKMLVLHNVLKSLLHPLERAIVSGFSTSLISAEF